MAYRLRKTKEIPQQGNTLYTNMEYIENDSLRISQ